MLTTPASTSRQPHRWTMIAASRSESVAAGLHDT
jgi:hypothetical protein